MVISLKNVSYSYRGKYQTVRAVDGVSYDFEPGKLYAIIGKSGSGKTTLMSLMAGLDLPTEGEIFVDGKSTREWDRHALRWPIQACHPGQQGGFSLSLIHLRSRRRKR